MTDLPTIEWEPADDGGWEASIGVLWFTISGDDSPPYTLTVGWHGDWTNTHCSSFEDGKRIAAQIAGTILEQALATVHRSVAAFTENKPNAPEPLRGK